jgi:hypothetical protein
MAKRIKSKADADQAVAGVWERIGALGLRCSILENEDSEIYANLGLAEAWVAFETLANNARTIRDVERLLSLETDIRDRLASVES